MNHETEKIFNNMEDEIKERLNKAYREECEMYCCEEMNKQVNHKCGTHKNDYDCPDKLISYNQKFAEYGIIIHDGGSSVMHINYCPFCGVKLPDSKRDLWFAKLKELGFEDPIGNDNIPKGYKIDSWHR
jgi:hypothetical protein